MIGLFGVDGLVGWRSALFAETIFDLEKHCLSARAEVFWTLHGLPRQCSTKPWRTPLRKLKRSRGM